MTVRNMTQCKTLWIIPARGGSKGIPGKNIKPFCGTPLVCRAVMQALQLASGDDRVAVSTDSEEIRSVARQCGDLPGTPGDVAPFLRPAELATDTSSSYDAIMHALNEMERMAGYRFDRVVLLQPTSPLRTTEDISDALRRWTPEVDMVVSVCEARTNPYYSAFETDSDGLLHISKGDGRYTRRQDAPEVWEYNGAVYVMTADSLRREPMSKFRRILPSPMPAGRSVDLDTPLDWVVAEAMYNELNRE